MPPCIQICNLTKCYGSVVALGGLSLTVEPGEVLGLLGANGAGKSTTLYMIAGLVPPTSGKITVFGKDLRDDFLSVARRMGVLTEQPRFYDFLSAKRNLALLARLSGRELTIDRSLDRVGLLHVANKKVGTFSLGMRQRLGLAQALLTEPELLILDEPTSGLDAEGARSTTRLLRQLADEAKVTILFSSHMLREVENLADRVAVLNKGRLLACDRIDALLSYDMRHVDVLVDAPEAATKRLNEEPWVESVHALPGRVSVELGDGTVHQLTSFLLSSGYVLSGVIPRQRTLQDYFLKVLNG